MTIQPSDIQRIASGRVRCVFTDDPQVLLRGRLLAADFLPHLRRVVCSLDVSSRIDLMLDDSLRQLALVAKSLWPDWYGGRINPSAITNRNALQRHLEQPFPSIAVPPDAISVSWLTVAAQQCLAGRLPLAPSFPRTVQARQLARVLTSNELLILLIPQQDTLCSQGLQRLAQAAEWLAQQTQARVVLVLLSAYREHSELDPVNYQALDVSTPVINSAVGASPTVVAHTPEPDRRLPTPWFGPIIGRPHPLSVGEQRLAQALAADAELCGLFEFNVWVDSVRGSRFLVDVLWRQGRLVVEVDGYAFHSDPVHFAQDRQRDYELNLSGYNVLRLTHDEVVAHTATAVAKIRDMVHLRIRQARFEESD